MLRPCVQVAVYVPSRIVFRRKQQGAEPRITLVLMVHVTQVRAGWRVVTWVGVALATWLVGAGSTGTLYGQSASATERGASAVRPRTIAVVPFANISGDPADEWLGSGIAETVITDLEQFGSLSIIGLEAFVDQAFRVDTDVAEDTERLAREAARDLAVSWIVTGGFQRLGDQLRITARIVEVETGTTYSTAKVDGHFADVFALQDRIVRELSDGFERIAGVPAPAVERVTGGDVLAPRGLRRGAGETARQGRGERRSGAFGAARSPDRAARSPDAAAPQVAPNGLAPAHVTGGIAIGDTEPLLGVAVGAGTLTGRPTVRPPRVQSPPAIDGRLDDAAWRDAAHLTDFVQRQPLDGAPATETTDVYLAYDSTTLYLGFHAHYSDPAMMRANRSDRDRAFRDDIFAVYLDTFLDQQRAYVFTVNGYGVQGDSIVNSRAGGGFGGGRGRGGPGGIPRGDESWDALFDTGGQLRDDGFTAEMAIPFKSLRYPQRGGDTPHRWGLQIVRRIGGKDETVVWSPVTRDVAGFLTQMGVMDGLSGLSTSRNIEILPTFTAIRFGSLDPASGDFVTGDPRPEGGVNLKYGVTSNLTADFTFNPDFSQIESDRPQIEVNQRFALFFPELRPFFLEGAEIFDIPGPIRPVHTRTIVDPFYGAKLTGKVGRTTVGVIYADDHAPGNVDDAADPAFDQSAQTFVGRVRYDLYAESHIGAIVTNREFLDSHSRLAGLDSNFRLGDTHSVAFRAMGTQHRDLDGLDKSGHYLEAVLRKQGRNLTYRLISFMLSPDFKTDVGFVRRTDQRRTFGNVAYRWWPEDWIVSWGPQARYARNYQFDGSLQDENAEVGLNVDFARNISVNGEVSRDMERYEGINFFKTRYRLFGRVSTSRRFGIGGGLNGGDEIFFDPADPYLGYETGLFSFISLRPISRLQSEVNINTSRFTDSRNGDVEVFDVNIFRALTTYQFTERFLFRNISEYNTFDKALGLNFLFTYRVNAGTVFYVGYDDHHQQADLIEGDLDGDDIADQLFFTTERKRTNRAVFLKLQYLFRY